MTGGGPTRDTMDRMDTVTLNTARKIAKAIESYKGASSVDALLPAIAEATLETPQTVSRVVEFLVELGKVQVRQLDAPQAKLPVVSPIDDGTPLNLADELTYNYKVAKRCLETSLLQDRVIDPEETRKSLRTLSTFLEQCLKLQERLYNAQQMQKFQEAVLDTIASVDARYRDTIIERLLT